MTPQDQTDPEFGGRLAFGERPALLLVDMVLAYLEVGSPLFAGADARAAVERAAALAKLARELSLPVIHTRVSYATPAQGGLFYRKVPGLRALRDGSPLGTFAGALEPTPSETVITKHYASAFFGTSLASLLVTLGVDTVLIAGFSTSGCVRASAVDALQHGFAPFVVADACADRRAEPHQASLFDLQAKYAEVVQSSDVTTLLRQVRR